MKTSTIKSRELQKRQALLEEGRAQGFSYGLSSLSVERVAANADISKRTLYKYFGSRDAFIAAIIAFDGDAWREWFFDAIREQADAPLKKLDVFFKTLALWTASSDFQGCLFAQVLCCKGGASEGAVCAAQEQMAYVSKFLQDHAWKAGVRNPRHFAASLLPSIMLLLSGASSLVVDNPGQHLETMAQALLHNDMGADEL